MPSASAAAVPGECPFCDILNGDAPGKIIARDEGRGFALIESIHPESVVHWLAIPTEHVPCTEVLEQGDGQRFLELFEFAVKQVREQREEIPQLYQGFTIKIHFGSYESVPHAKLHVLGTE
jgi:histidine triad (HIT) family protein